MSAAPQLVPPVNGRTGSLVQQPKSGELIAGALLDVQANWIPCQFLDAPEWLPTGGIQAIQFGELTVLIAETQREGLS
jgi:hypothetical protein